jgi:hypothetical protein
LSGRATSSRSGKSSKPTSELVAADRFEFIRDAQETDLDFSERPLTVTECYTLLGFPDDLSERAASDTEANAASSFKIDMRTLHSGATYAPTHLFQGKEGASLDGYVRTANDILFNRMAPSSASSGPTRNS